MAHNEWLECELQIIKDNYEDMTDDELALLIPAHSEKSIATKRRRMGLQREGLRRSFNDVENAIRQNGYELLSSEDEFNNTSSIVKFKCPIHGEQSLPASRLLSGRGCKECGKERASHLTKRVSNDRDIYDCQSKNLTYIETTRVKTNNVSNVMVSFVCNVHADKGVQTVRRGSLHNSQKPCKYCSHRNLSRAELMEVINDCKLEHIEIMSNDINFIKDRVKCKCTLHNVMYETLVESVLEGRGCDKCTIDKKRNFLSYSEAQDKLRKIKPDVELISYEKCALPITVRCLKCGELWSTKITEPSRCPNCDNKFIGESLIYQYLKNNEIPFIPQYRFEDCVDKHELVYDFYLPSLNTCIEYNGKQHYMPIKHFGGDERFLVQKRHDEIKRKYCKDNEINLIEIKYTIKTYAKIEEYLKNAI